jgi:PEP-CTERM motif-containing protein
MRCLRAVALLALLFGFQTVRTNGQVVASWTDGTGNWSNPANWSTHTVPNNGGGTTYDVVINGTASNTVTYDVNGTVIDSLSITNQTFQDSASGTNLNAGSLSVNLDTAFNWTHGGTLTASGFSEFGGIALLSVISSKFVVNGDFSDQSGQALIQDSSMRVGGNFGIAQTLESSKGFTFTNSILKVDGELFVGEVSSLIFNVSNVSVGGNYRNSGSPFTSKLTLNDSKMQVSGDFSSGGPDLSGGLQLDAGSALSVSGTITNYGPAVLSNSTIKVAKDFFNSDVQNNFEGNLVLKDGSSLVVNGLFTNRSVLPFDSLELVGSGNSAALGSVQNDGLVQVDQGSSFRVTTGGMINTSNGIFTLGGTGKVSGGFTNAGGAVILNPTAVLVSDTYTQSSGSTDIFGKLRTGAYTQSGGSTTIETDGKLTTNSFTATGGTVTVNGTLDPAAVLFTSGADLRGTGSIVGNVVVDGTIMPGAPGAPGTLTIVGNYQQLNTGTLIDLMSPVSQSLLNVRGNVVLGPDSILQISLLNGFNPLGQTFDVMSYGALFGQFANGTSFWGDGYLWNLTYGQNEIEVTAVSATPEPSSFLFLGLGLLGLMTILFKNRSFISTPGNVAY